MSIRTYWDLIEEPDPIGDFLVGAWVIFLGRRLTPFERVLALAGEPPQVLDDA